MAKDKPNIALSSYDDIFETEESRERAEQQVVQNISIAELHPFKDHPFKVLEDEEMQKMVESITEYGVLTPAIARPRPEGGYELVAGHRRCHASELAGLTELPVIVREMDDDAATILMVDSNLQRENILPSERAFAFKMKLDAMKRQSGRKSKENVSQLGTQKRSDQIMADEIGESRNQIQRFIRLTKLTPELLQMVDDRQLAFNPAVEISYLKPEEQKLLIDAMDYAQATPSLSQAQRLKKFSQQGMLKYEVMCAVMSEEKKGMRDKVTLKSDVLKKYFPSSTTPQEMENTIIKLLDQWQKHKSRDGQSL